MSSDTNSTCPSPYRSWRRCHCDRFRRHRLVCPRPHCAYWLTRRRVQRIRCGSQRAFVARTVGPQTVAVLGVAPFNFAPGERLGKPVGYLSRLCAIGVVEHSRITAQRSRADVCSTKKNIRPVRAVAKCVTACPRLRFNHSETGVSNTSFAGGPRLVRWAHQNRGPNFDHCRFLGV